MKNNKKLIIITSIIVLVIVGAVVSLIIYMNSGNDDDTSYSDDAYYENDNSSNSKKTTEELTESEKMITKIMSLIQEKLAFDTGNYIKGDIPKGEYAFIKFEGSGSYYSEKDASGSILDNENFDSFGYVKVHEVGNLETNGVLINITAFEKLGVSGAKEIYEILNDLTNYNQSGYYKVGTDIEAGNYIVESIGSEGYYSIKSGPVSGGKILDNDFVDGRASIKLKNGQYIEISKLELIKQ